MIREKNVGKNWHPTQICRTELNRVRKATERFEFSSARFSSQRSRGEMRVCVYFGGFTLSAATPKADAESDGHDRRYGAWYIGISVM